ncbi:MAG: cation-translocating P-type ATPase, partial [Nitrospirae bacterium]|nr:cation-translocating P-type ATPase [Nitrospirota bacterium]
MTSLWHTLTTEALEQELQSDIDTGLTASEAQHRLAAIGPNELPEAAPPSPRKICLSQFANLIVWVLIGAAAVSGLLQAWIDAVAILAIVVL